MIQLYYHPGNASLAPHMLLEEIGAPFELVLVDRANAAHKSPEYLKLNPNGQIPVLVEGDFVLYEAAAICLYLADRYPDAKLVPPLQDAGARALLPVALLVHQHAAGDADALLLQRAHGRRRRRQRGGAGEDIAPKRGPAPCSTGSTSNWPRTAATGCSARRSARSIRMR